MSVCVILACVQWKEAGDRKREDILLGKWFQVTQACCPQPQTPETPTSVQAPPRLLASPPPASRLPPPPLISTWRGSDYIFGGFIDKPGIKMAQASSFSHVRAPELGRT